MEQIDVTALPVGRHLTPQMLGILDSWCRSSSLPVGILTGAVIEAADYLGLDTGRLFDLLAPVVAPRLEATILQEAKANRFGTVGRIVCESRGTHFSMNPRLWDSLMATSRFTYIRICLGRDPRSHRRLMKASFRYSGRSVRDGTSYLFPTITVFSGFVFTPEETQVVAAGIGDRLWVGPPLPVYSMVEHGLVLPVLFEGKRKPLPYIFSSGQRLRGSLQDLPRLCGVVGINYEHGRFD
jgi:hypothetical protein